MRLLRTTQAHLDVLMAWFEDKDACRLWGGPYFRYPYNLRSFKEDIAWDDYDSFSLLGESKQLLGFGQLYIKGVHIHMARLVVSPKHRGSGYGKQLVESLLLKGKSLFALPAFSLYVYKHNKVAIHCYQSMGFVRHEYPVGAPFERECFFMIKKD